MKNLTIALIPALLVLSGCAMHQKILDAGAVSMTHQGLKTGETLKETGPVTGQFCSDSMNDKGSIGLMDEAIKAAQKDSGADYITNATFYIVGQGCVSVEGTGNKVVASNGTTEETTTTTKTRKH